MIKSMATTNETLMATNNQILDNLKSLNQRVNNLESGSNRGENGAKLREAAKERKRNIKAAMWDLMRDEYANQGLEYSDGEEEEMRGYLDKLSNNPSSPSTNSHLDKLNPTLGAKASEKRAYPNRGGNNSPYPCKPSLIQSLRDGSSTPANTDTSFSRPPTIKQEHLGTFWPDCSEAEKGEGVFKSAGAWWRGIIALWNSYSGPNIATHQAQILMQLPYCLKGEARQWYNALDSDGFQRLSKSIWEWEVKCIDAFRPSIEERTVLADRRRWDSSKERAVTYYYHKLELVRDCYDSGDQPSEALLCRKIKEGMDRDDSILIHAADWANPSLSKMLKEIKLVDGARESSINKAKAGKASLFGTPLNQTTGRFNSLNTTFNQSTPTTRTFTPLTNQQQSTNYRQPQTPPLTPLSQSYNPSMVSFDKEGRRQYTTPTGRTIRLTKNCSICNQAHFDFEHHHSNRLGNKARVHFADAGEEEEEEKGNWEAVQDSDEEQDENNALGLGINYNISTEREDF